MLKDRRPTRSAWRRFAACGLVVGQNAIGELHPTCTSAVGVGVSHAASDSAVVHQPAGAPPMRWETTEDGYVDAVDRGTYIMSHYVSLFPYRSTRLSSFDIY